MLLWTISLTKGAEIEIAGASKQQNMSSSGQYDKTHYDRKNYDPSYNRISGAANYDAKVL